MKADALTTMFSLFACHSTGRHFFTIQIWSQIETCSGCSSSGHVILRFPRRSEFKNGGAGVDVTVAIVNRLRACSCQKEDIWFAANAVATSHLPPSRIHTNLRFIGFKQTEFTASFFHFFLDYRILSNKRPLSIRRPSQLKAPIHLRILINAPSPINAPSLLKSPMQL